MKKLLFLTLLVFSIFSCNNPTEEINSVDETDTVHTQEIETKEISVNHENDTLIEQVPEKEPEKVQNVAALKLPNEEIVFSFKTEKGKTMNIVIDKDEKYMAYRFGTENKLELQFPEELTNSFEQFRYNFYFRGGGAANMGLDLNYLSFSGDTHKFIIFQEYSAEGEDGEGESSTVGIRIVNLKTKKEIEIKGINSTISGDLSVFRDNDLVKIVDEI